VIEALPSVGGVGPWVVVAHSHGGAVAFRALHERPAQVRGVVAIEPSGFAEPVRAPAVAGKPFLFVYGDYLDATPLWTRLAAAGRDYAGLLARHGAAVESWRLAEMGVAGNSHMLMMDDNSDAIARRISDWVLEQRAVG